MTRFPEISAIILAAGFSRRMGRFKPLLPLGGQTVLQRVVSLYRKAGVTDIRVVAGYRREAIRSALAGQPVQIIDNPQPDKGMFSSVLAGVKALLPDAQSFFVHPVDIPLVRAYTLAVLMDAGRKTPSPVAYPVFGGRRGHPPLVHRDLKTEICAHDGSGGLRALLARFDSTALEVPVADKGVLLDLDTPDDFRRLAARLDRSDCLTTAECGVLMQQVHRLPDRLIDHCRQVACVTRAVAGAINAGGGNIDGTLAESAALVHDVTRPERAHAANGARLLQAMGFPAMSAIVAAHMEMQVAPDAPLDEAQIVYLADKLVAGSEVVGLTHRFDVKLKKIGHDPAAAAAIDRRRQTALIIQSKVVEASGRTIHQILNQAGIIHRNRSCPTV